MEEILSKIDELKEIMASYSADKMKNITLRITANAIVDSELKNELSGEVIERRFGSKVVSSIKIDDYETE